MNDLIEQLEAMVNDYTVISGDRVAVKEAITALREYKDANMKAAILHGEDVKRLAELEWNYEAACCTVEVRDKEIERLDAALAEIIKDGVWNECQYCNHKCKVAEKARAGE